MADTGFGGAFVALLLMLGGVFAAQGLVNIWLDDWKRTLEYRKFLAALEHKGE